MLLMSEIGNRLRTLREQAGLTQYELASRSGILPATISRIESGITPDPRQDTMRKLAKALGVSVGVLIGSDSVDEEINAERQRILAILDTLPPDQRAMLERLFDKLVGLPEKTLNAMELLVDEFQPPETTPRRGTGKVLVVAEDSQKYQANGET